MGRVYYDDDADLSVLENRKIAVLGYGNQGRAQALNLRDGGLTVVVGVRADASRDLAGEDGFATLTISQATREADVLLLLVPDEVMPRVFDSEIGPVLSEGRTLCFASGYNVAFGLIETPPGVDVVMLAPRMIGAGVRQRYIEGKGFPSFIGIHKDASGSALETVLALARGIGSTRCGAMMLTFAQEAALDLFTEQAFGPAFGQVLLSAIQTLLDAGYPVEAVMTELILSGEFAYSMQKIVELGFFGQMELHSHTSQYGSMTRSIRFASPHLSETMRRVLDEIENGTFADEWTAEQKSGLVVFNQIREMRAAHPIAEWERRARLAFRLDPLRSPGAAGI